MGYNEYFVYSKSNTDIKKLVNVLLRNKKAKELDVVLLCGSKFKNDGIFSQVKILGKNFKIDRFFIKGNTQGLVIRTNCMDRCFRSIDKFRYKIKIHSIDYIVFSSNGINDKKRKYTDYFEDFRIHIDKNIDCFTKLNERY